MSKQCISIGQAQSLTELPGIGPASCRMLAAVGIDSVAKLRAIGAVAAYQQVRKQRANISLNLLWALEGALTNQAWQQIAKTERHRLLIELDAASQAD